MSYIHKNSKNENLFSVLFFRFFPYWPVFLGLLITSLLIAWIFLKYSIPLYEASATLIINDEKKGVDQSQIMESMNAFDSKKIIENEIEVIQSREVLRNVVQKLNLDAPVYIDHGVKESSAYLTSPIRIKLKNSDKLGLNSEEPIKYDFSYDTKSQKVYFRNKYYVLNKWINTPQGELMFLLNSEKENSTSNDFYFYMVNPKIAVQGILERLSASATDKLSTVVNLTFQDEIPQRAEDILNNIIFFYTQKSVDDKNLLAKNTLDFIDKRMTGVEEDLTVLEKKVQQYRSGSDVVNLSEQGKLYLQDRGANDREIAEIAIKLDVFNQLSDLVYSKGTTISPSSIGIDDPVLEELLSKLSTAELKYESLKKTTAENNPIIVSVKNEIEKLRENINQNVVNQKNNLNTSLKSLRRNSGEYSSVLRTLPEKERTLVDISRKKQVKTELYSFLLQKKEETALAYGSVAGENRIVDVAQASLNPVSPKKILVYLIAIMAGFIIAVSYVVLKEVLTNKILFRSEIEKYLELPIVAELPFIKKETTTSIKSTNESILAGQFRNVRLALGLYVNGGRKKIILVNSSMEGEGKSFVSSNLAKSLASKAHKTLIIDFDFQKSELSKIFSHQESAGLAEVILNKVHPYEVIRRTDVDNLDIMPTGTATQETLKAMLECDLQEIFNQLQKEYEYIIIDTLPIGISRDADFLANYCDNMLFVVRHGYTPKKELENFAEYINVEHSKKTYIIFNGFKSRGFATNGYGYAYQSKNQYKSAYGSVLAKQ